MCPHPTDVLETWSSNSWYLELVSLGSNLGLHKVMRIGPHNRMNGFLRRAHDPACLLPHHVVAPSTSWGNRRLLPAVAIRTAHSVVLCDSHRKWTKLLLFASLLHPNLFGAWEAAWWSKKWQGKPNQTLPHTIYVGVGKLVCLHFLIW
jgi:hypothetical protein